MIFHETEIENPILSGNNKKKTADKRIYSFLFEKVRVQKPKLNYTLENDNTFRIIMSMDAAVTREGGPMFFKKKKIQFDCFFPFYHRIHV